MSQEELKFSNSIPTEEDLHKMVAKLVVEKAEAMERIHDLLKENTELRKENQRLNNVLNELENWLHIKIEISSKQEYLGFYTMILDKVIELKESDK